MALSTVFTLGLFICFCNAETLEPPATPAYIIIGKRSGEILRCPVEHPTSCEIYYEGYSEIISTLVHGQHLYASLNSGVILQCDWREKDSCITFERIGAIVHCLIIIEEHLYAGIEGGRLFKIDLNEQITTVHTFKKSVRALYEHDKYIYVAGYQFLSKCIIGAELNCEEIPEASNGRFIDYKSVAAWGDTIVALTWEGYVWTIDPKDIIITSITGQEYYDMAIFKGDMYVVDNSGDINKCRWDIDDNCTTVATHGHAVSVSFAYSSHPLQNKIEEHSCIHHSAFLNGSEDIASKEVRIIDGKICNYKNVVLNSKGADIGYSGHAFVFVMGPGGHILVSESRSSINHFKNYLTSVSAVGEMHVKDGVIEKIVACSVFYKPDNELNKQVVAALYSKGYTRDVKLEECDYSCRSEPDSGSVLGCSWMMLFVQVFLAITL